jgi:hypothetical protein
MVSRNMRRAANKRNQVQGMAMTSPTGTQPTVVAFAGQRIDADGAKAARFPFANVCAVRAAIGSSLERIAPSLLIASAACGADLMALEAATSRHIPMRIVLPFPPQRFRATSVVDRPNPEFWGRLYIKGAEQRGDVIVLHCSENDSGTYSAANKAIIDTASAASAAPSTRRVALLVWDGIPRGGDDTTKQFAELAERSGFSVLSLSTLDPQPVAW